MRFIDYFGRFMWDTIEYGWGSDIKKLLFYVSLIIIWLFERSRTKRNTVVLYCVLTLLIVYCPITMCLAHKVFFSNTQEIISYYSRMFTAFPLVFTVAYAIILISRKAKNGKSYFVVLLLVISIASTRMAVYNFRSYSLADNPEKVSREVKQISESLADVDGYKTVLMPIIPNEFIRTIDTSIITPYSKDNIDEYIQLPAVRQISGRDQLVVEDVCRYCDENNCDFIVLDDDDAQLFAEIGYENYTKTDAYTILKVKHPG